MRYILISYVFLTFLSGFVVAESTLESNILESNGEAVVLIATYNEVEGTIEQGSGFVVRDDGVIITNYHVIKDSYPIIVKFINGDIYRDLLVINLDKVRDIAIIKINGWNLPTVRIGDSKKVKVGDKLIVIGNPEGLSNTLSSGLLSGIRTHPDGYKMHQIDAAISSGSSGSPVFDSNGGVIGIATATIQSGQNLNFSIPINYAKPFLDDQPIMTLEEFAGKQNEKVVSHDEKKEQVELSKSECMREIHNSIVSLLYQRDNFIRALPSFFEQTNISDMFLVQEYLNELLVAMDMINCENDSIQVLKNELYDYSLKFRDGVKMLTNGAKLGNQVTISEGMAQVRYSFNKIINYRLNYMDLYNNFKLDSLFEVIPFLEIPFIAELPAFGFELSYSQERNAEIIFIYEGHRRHHFYEIGDIIKGTSEDFEFNNVKDFLMFVSEKEPGDKVRIKVLRDGKEKSYNIYLK